MTGIALAFIAPLLSTGMAHLPGFFDYLKVGQVVEISEEDARATAKKLAQEEGVFAGMSNGDGFKNY